MDAETVENNMKYIRELVIPSMARRMKETQLKDHAKFSKHHKIIEEMLRLNSKVMIQNVDRSAKSDPKFIGPYFIRGYTTNSTYMLEDTLNQLLQRDVPLNQIRVLQRGDKRPENELLEEHYEVRAIINYRLRENNQYEYLTSFVGYKDPEWIIDTDFDSLEPVRNYW